MEYFYQALYAWVQAHGLQGAFVFMALESGGFPLPTAVGFVVAQGLINTGAATYLSAFLWIVAGHMVGAGVSYHLGRASDSALARRLAHKPSVMAAREKMQQWFERYGALAVLLGRLAGHVRPWSSFIAGLAGVPQPTFWLWTLLGTMIFTAVTMWMTVVGWQYWQAYPQWRVPAIIATAVVFYGLPLAKLVEQLVRRAQRRRELQADDD